MQAIATTYPIYYFTCRQQQEKEPVLRGVLQAAAVLFAEVQWSATGKVVPTWMQGILVALPVLMGLLEKKVFACFTRVMRWIAPVTMLISSAALMTLGKKVLGGSGLAFLALQQFLERKMVPLSAVIGIETFGAVMTVAFGSWMARSALILSLARDLFKKPVLVDVRGCINGPMINALQPTHDYPAIREAMAIFFSDEKYQMLLLEWARKQGYQEMDAPNLYHLIDCFLIHHHIIRKEKAP
jgi:hypothetical protein